MASSASPPAPSDSAQRSAALARGRGPGAFLSAEDPGRIDSDFRGLPSVSLASPGATREFTGAYSFARNGFGVEPGAEQEAPLSSHGGVSMGGGYPFPPINVSPHFAPVFTSGIASPTGPDGADREPRTYYHSPDQIRGLIPQTSAVAQKKGNENFTLLIFADDTPVTQLPDANFRLGYLLKRTTLFLPLQSNAENLRAKLSELPTLIGSFKVRTERGAQTISAKSEIQRTLKAVFEDSTRNEMFVNNFNCILKLQNLMNDVLSPTLRSLDLVPLDQLLTLFTDLGAVRNFDNQQMQKAIFRLFLDLTPQMTVADRVRYLQKFYVNSGNNGDIRNAIADIFHERGSVSVFTAPAAGGAMNLLQTIDSEHTILLGNPAEMSPIQTQFARLYLESARSQYEHIFCEIGPNARLIDNPMAAEAGQPEKISQDPDRANRLDTLIKEFEQIETTFTDPLATHPLHETMYRNLHELARLARNLVLVQPDLKAKISEESLLNRLCIEIDHEENNGDYAAARQYGAAPQPPQAARVAQQQVAQHRRMIEMDAAKTRDAMEKLIQERQKLLGKINRDIKAWLSGLSKPERDAKKEGIRDGVDQFIAAINGVFQAEIAPEVQYPDPRAVITFLTTPEADVTTFPEPLQSSLTELKESFNTLTTTAQDLDVPKQAVLKTLLIKSLTEIWNANLRASQLQVPPLPPPEEEAGVPALDGVGAYTAATLQQDKHEFYQLSLRGRERVPRGAEEADEAEGDETALGRIDADPQAILDTEAERICGVLAAHSPDEEIPHSEEVINTFDGLITELFRQGVLNEMGGVNLPIPNRVVIIINFTALNATSQGIIDYLKTLQTQAKGQLVFLASKNDVTALAPPSPPLPRFRVPLPPPPPSPPAGAGGAPARAPIVPPDPLQTAVTSGLLQLAACDQQGRLVEGRQVSTSKRLALSGGRLLSDSETAAELNKRLTDLAKPSTPARPTTPITETTYQTVLIRHVQGCFSRSTQHLFQSRDLSTIGKILTMEQTILKHPSMNLDNLKILLRLPHTINILTDTSNSDLANLIGQFPIEDEADIRAALAQLREDARYLDQQEAVDDDVSDIRARIDKRMQLATALGEELNPDVYQKAFIDADKAWLDPENGAGTDENSYISAVAKAAVQTAQDIQRDGLLALFPEEGGEEE